MGSSASFLVVVDDDQLTLASALCRRAQRRAEELESRWSRFCFDSDIARCNRERGLPVPVSPDTIGLVSHAVDAWRFTDGLYDPTVHDALERHGYDRSYDVVRKRRADREHADAMAVNPTPGCDGIVIDGERGTVTLPHGVGFDAGGIGKGFAADVLTEEAIRAGALGALACLGGDVRVRGIPPDGQDWVISLEDPVLGEGELLQIRLRDGAVATSSTLARRWNRGSRHHLIDPSTGCPANNGVVAATVVASVGWWAEALTKVVFVGGVGAGLSELRRLGEGASGFMVDSAGRCHRSENLDPFLVQPVLQTERETEVGASW